MRGGCSSLVVSCALAIVLAACGSEKSPRPVAASSTAAPEATATTETAKQAGPVLEPLGPRGGLEFVSAPNPWKEPRIRAHPDASVTHLIVRDVKKGTGPAVRPHDYVLIDFIEAIYTSGVLYNKAWSREPAAGVILTRVESWRGLTAGMTGMRVGGRRTIVVPPQLSGTERTDWNYRRVLYWDVVLRGIVARGCADAGQPCRSRVRT